MLFFRGIVIYTALHPSGIWRVFSLLALLLFYKYFQCIHVQFDTHGCIHTVWDFGINPLKHPANCDCKLRVLDDMLW